MNTHDASTGASGAALVNSARPIGASERRRAATVARRPRLLARVVFVLGVVLAGLCGSGTTASADVLSFGPDTCAPGFVWREAFAGDTACVTPSFRARVLADNAAAASRRQPGSLNCVSGYVWRVARPSDLVCVTPSVRTRVAAQNGVPDANKQAFAPGTHTVDLGMASHLKRVVSRGFNSCRVFPKQNDELLVGWMQYEDDGTPCMAESSQVAVQFDTRVFERIPGKVVNRAVLIYDERQASGCNVGLPGGGPCWTSGSRQPENKPNGCVVVRVPATNWAVSPPSGEFPFVTHPSGRPTVIRLDSRSWDVTEPFRWQKERGAMPLQPLDGPALNSGFGFLLSGGLTIGQLQAEDNTNCLSTLANVRLQLTYTVSTGTFTQPR